jgi:CheY-like chemotaxis protein
MSSQPGKSYLILIVDDNDELLKSLSFALRTLGGYRIEVATNGAEGLEKAVELRPDCMVVDVKMPEINGLQLARAMRGDPATADVPLVILSALVQDADRAVGMFAGADQYLTKPSKPQAVIAAIQRAITLTAEERARRLNVLAESETEDV